MVKEIPELERVGELLKIEKAEDFELFRQKILQLSLEDRKEQGYTWYPLQVVSSGYTYGERAFVVVERGDDQTAHQFRSGKVVQLFTKEAGAYQPERNGVVFYVEKKRMKIILNAKDLPDWIGGGKLG